MQRIDENVSRETWNNSTAGEHDSRATTQQGAKVWTTAGEQGNSQIRTHGYIITCTCTHTDI